jgi:thymidylate synthase
MLVLSASSASELFTQACRAVLATGTPVQPRGLPTMEVLGAALTLTSPRQRLVDVPPVRMLNPAFAAAEAVWILSGSDEPWIFQYNQQLARFADNGRLMGAYGPRLRRWHGTLDQLAHVRRVLAADPASRQAVIQLFDPEVDSRGHRDVPCTLGYRFFVRDGKLHMHTTMRSQDLWLGFGYDIFTATIMQELLAGWLGAELGSYCLFADSLHLYEHDIRAARRLPDTPAPSTAMPPLETSWEDLDDMLAAVIGGDPVDVPAWAEFAAVMASYRAWKTGQHDAARLRAAERDGPLARALGRWYEHLSTTRQPGSAATAGRPG